MTYGYCRISTRKQNIERQIRNILSEFSDAIILQEEYTGTKLDRKEWNKLFSSVRAGDTIIFDSVSRMSRNAAEGVEAYAALYKRGVNLVFLKERHIDTDTYRQTLQNSVQLTGGDVDYILEGVNRYMLALARRQIYLAFGHIKTKDIQYAHLQRYIDDLAGDLKVKSLKKHLVVINGALEDAERSGIISSNPARLVQMPRESEKFVGNTLNEEEAKEALSAAQEEGEPMYAIVILGMVYGLRRSEMCGLRWKDIDFENGYIHVCNTVVKGKSGHIEEESTKTEKSNRYLPLIGFTIPYFRDLLQQQISSGSKCDKVCQLSDGSPVLPDYITHKYKEFLAAHNLPDIRVHDMRHTAASLLAAHDATPQQAQEFLGHENISTALDIYTHCLDESKRKTADIMDKIYLSWVLDAFLDAFVTGTNSPAV